MEIDIKKINIQNFGIVFKGVKPYNNIIYVHVFKYQNNIK